MICKNCGNEIQKDEFFCSECGTGIQFEGESLEDKAKTPKKQKWILILCAALIALVGIVIMLQMNSYSTSLENQVEIGYKYIGEGQYEEAILAFDKAIEINPKSIISYAGKANVQILSGDFDEALHTIEILASLDPRDGGSGYSDIAGEESIYTSDFGLNSPAELFKWYLEESRQRHWYEKMGELANEIEQNWEIADIKYATDEEIKQILIRKHWKDPMGITMGTTRYFEFYENGTYLMVGYFSQEKGTYEVKGHGVVFDDSEYFNVYLDEEGVFGEAQKVELQGEWYTVHALEPISEDDYYHLLEDYNEYQIEAL